MQRDKLAVDVADELIRILLSKPETTVLRVLFLDADRLEKMEEGFMFDPKIIKTKLPPSAENITGFITIDLKVSEKPFSHHEHRKICIITGVAGKDDPGFKIIINPESAFNLNDFAQESNRWRYQFEEFLRHEFEHGRQNTHQSTAYDNTPLPEIRNDQNKFFYFIKYHLLPAEIEAFVTGLYMYARRKHKSVYYVFMKKFQETRRIATLDIRYVKNNKNSIEFNKLLELDQDLLNLTLHLISKLNLFAQLLIRAKKKAQKDDLNDALKDIRRAIKVFESRIFHGAEVTSNKIIEDLKNKNITNNIQAIEHITDMIQNNSNKLATYFSELKDFTSKLQKLKEFEEPLTELKNKIHSFKETLANDISDIQKAAVFLTDVKTVLGNINQFYSYLRSLELMLTKLEKNYSLFYLDIYAKENNMYPLDKQMQILKETYLGYASKRYPMCNWDF